jgi:hypothetical protein
MKRLLVFLVLGLAAWLTVQSSPQPPAPPAIVRPATPRLSVEVPAFQQYAGIVKQLDTWHAEAPGLTERGSYGTSRGGRSLEYLRLYTVHEKKNHTMRNFRVHVQRPAVLVTACIHGNEPWSTSVVMGYIGRLLANYGKDEAVTAILDSRDIYFVPVVSPDSYPNSRHVDGVDPNRDFPGPHDPNRKSTPSIAALQSLFLKIHPKAAWSGHTFGRQFLTPYGDTTERCKDDAAFNTLFDEMARLANYKHLRSCQLYGSVIHGSEVDWYYRNGAASCVCEYGTHQHAPSLDDTQSELNRTWSAFVKFLQEAPTLLGSRPAPSPVPDPPLLSPRLPPHPVPGPLSPRFPPYPAPSPLRRPIPLPPAGDNVIKPTLERLENRTHASTLHLLSHPVPLIDTDYAEPATIGIVQGLPHSLPGGFPGSPPRRPPLTSTEPNIIHRAILSRSQKPARTSQPEPKETQCSLPSNASSD